MSQQFQMAQIFGQGGFDTESVAAATDFQVIPAGKYPVLIEKAELKPTKANDGLFIELQLQILDGDFKGRKLWDRINIANPSQECVQIGVACLAALGKALGMRVVQNESQLINGVCIAHVKIDKHDQNAIRTYSAIEKPPQAAPAYAQPAPAAPPVYAQPVPAPVYAPPVASPAPFIPQQAPAVQPNTANMQPGTKPIWAR